MSNEVVNVKNDPIFSSPLVREDNGIIGELNGISDDIHNVTRRCRAIEKHRNCPKTVAAKMDMMRFSLGHCERYVQETIDIVNDIMSNMRNSDK